MTGFDIDSIAFNNASRAGRSGAPSSPPVATGGDHSLIGYRIVLPRASSGDTIQISHDAGFNVGAWVKNRGSEFLLLDLLTFFRSSRTGS
jgi:hypothetical protein